MAAGETSIEARLANSAAVIVVLADAVAEESDVVLLAVVGVEIAGGAGKDVEACFAGIIAGKTNFGSVVVVAVYAGAGGSGVAEIGR